MIPAHLLLTLDPVKLAARSDFTPFRPGIDMISLYQEPDNGPGAAILRYAPGAQGPRHRHAGYEHVYVLAGEQRDEHGSYPAGTLRINAPGTHHRVTSPNGSLILIIWERAVVFDEADA